MTWFGKVIFVSIQAKTNKLHTLWQRKATKQENKTVAFSPVVTDSRHW